MKKLIAFLAIIMMTLSVFAQSPEKMSYQCVVRNASGLLVTNQSVGIRISILHGSASGSVVYQEIYNPNPQTNANGLLSIEIGGGLAITGTFSSINWATGIYFLKTETDPTGGTNYTIVGTSQLLSVPYAIYANTAGNGFSGNYYDLINLPIVFSGNYDDLTNKPLLFDGTWGSLNEKPFFASVASTGNYNDLLNRPTLFTGTWADITGKPTTLAGYGITDAMNTSHVANGITSTLISNWNTAFTWGNHTGLYRQISYVPSWSEITSKPTTLAGFGISDAVSTSGNQTIAGIKTFTGTINAGNNIITNAADPVNPSDVANRAYVDALKAQIEALEDDIIEAGIYKLTDVEGNKYKVVKIGDQIWMAENLRTSRYNDGSPIPNVTDNTEWANLRVYLEFGPVTYGAFCWYNNDSANFENDYGKLYNSGAVQTGMLCPVGWHVPSTAEWEILCDPFVIPDTDDIAFPYIIIGNELMETGTAHWVRGLGTNETGFTALPGGIRTEGAFRALGEVGDFWCSGFYEDNYSGFAPFHPIPYTYIFPVTPINGMQPQIDGLSVRCIKD